MLDRVMGLLDRYEFSSREERRIQDAIAEILVANEIPFKREVALSPGNRPDFMLDGIALEVKVGGSTTEVFRQMQRYASEPAVKAVLLVTTRTQHARARVGQLAGKPVGVFLVPGGLA